MIQELLLYLDIKAVKKKKAHMTLSKAGASVHSQHHSILWKGQLRSKASGTINKFAIMRHFHSHTSTQKQSQNLLFKKKKKKLARFPKQKPHLHQTWYPWVPDVRSRHRRRHSCCLLHRLLSWCHFQSYVIGGADRTPWLSSISSASIAPSVKIRKSAHKDEPRALPLFTHEAPLYSSVRLKE